MNKIEKFVEEKKRKSKRNDEYNEILNGNACWILDITLALIDYRIKKIKEFGRLPKYFEKDFIWYLPVYIFRHIVMNNILRIKNYDETKRYASQVIKYIKQDLKEINLITEEKKNNERRKNVGSKKRPGSTTTNRKTKRTN